MEGVTVDRVEICLQPDNPKTAKATNAQANRLILKRIMGELPSGPEVDDVVTQKWATNILIG